MVQRKPPGRNSTRLDPAEKIHHTAARTTYFLLLLLFPTSWSDYWPKDLFFFLVTSFPASPLLICKWDESKSVGLNAGTFFL